MIMVVLGLILTMIGAAMLAKSISVITNPNRSTPKYSGITTIHNTCTKNIAPKCIEQAFDDIGYDVLIIVNPDSCTTTFIIAER